MSTEDEELYPCVGVCMVDQTSGLCMGCGKPVQEPAEPERAGERPASEQG
jgi:predicted Fe-S protein YdhL (DUF1289 family)